MFLHQTYSQELPAGRIKKRQVLGNGMMGGGYVAGRGYPLGVRPPYAAIPPGLGRGYPPGLGGGYPPGLGGGYPPGLGGAYVPGAASAYAGGYGGGARVIGQYFILHHCTILLLFSIFFLRVSCQSLDELKRLS